MSNGAIALSSPEILPGAREARDVGSLSSLTRIWWFGWERTRAAERLPPIRRDPRVTLYYFDRESQAYVTIYGIARLVNGPKAKLKWWKDDWKDFYPNRTKDFPIDTRHPPEQLEVVNVKKRNLKVIRTRGSRRR